MRQVEDWIDAYLKYTYNTEPRVSYRTWVAISAVASALQRKCYLQWGAETWYPNFYIILTGPPAARKGTAMKPARKFLNRMGIALAADESSRQKLINRMKEAATPTQSESGKLRFHSSMTISATELTVFLKSADIDMISTLCKWYDCEERFIYETISRQTQDIDNVWVNLVAATTPRLLQSALPPDTFGSGLISRTLFIYEEDKDRMIIYPSLDKDLAQDLLLDLEKIGLLEGQFKLADPAQELIEAYTEWRTLQEKDPPIKDPRLLDYNQRQPMHMWKLCMIFSASRSDELVINHDDFAKATAILHSMERKMPMAFAGIGQNPLVGTQSQIMNLLVERKAIAVRELMNMFFHEVTQQQMSEIIGTLVAMGFCKYDIEKRLITLWEK